jgi:hypothetical protein
VADVFISYSRLDQAHANAVAGGLESRGWSVWFDTRLIAGDTWDDVIERELTNAGCVVVLWSKHSVKSRWVRAEARRALKAHKLVPATVDGAPTPVDFDEVQTADLANWQYDLEHQGFLSVVEGVRRVMHGVPHGANPSPAAVLRPSRRFGKRALLCGMGAVVLLACSGIAYWKPWAQTTVLLMDSPLPDVVYDKDAAAKGQTNATAISDILKDLPVVVMKESTDLEWHREDEIRKLSPSLIIIHSSAFYSRTNGSDNAGKLISFLGYMKSSTVRFLIYSRVSPEGFERVVRERFPELSGRVQTWQVPGGPAASFNDPVTRRTLKELVRKVLNL